MPRTRWTEERVRGMAETCSSRYEFKRASQSAYNAARKIPGLLDDYFGYQITYWDEEALRALPSRYKNRSELEKSEDSGALAALKRLGLADELFPIEATIWNKHKVLVEALKYETRTEFMYGTPGAYGWAARNNMLDDLHTSKVIPWTVQALTDEAQKYDSKRSFHLGNGGAYNAALRMGLIDTLFDNRFNSWHTEDLIRAEAVKYQCKVEFMRGAIGAYNAARRLGILNTLGFKPGRYGYDSSKPGYIYVCDLRLTDSNDGVMFGVTNQTSRERYHRADRAHISNFTAYLFLNGLDALAIETELKRRFSDKKITSNQSPLLTKKGTSGEIVTGVQRSLVELEMLGINSKFDGFEHW